MVDSRKLNYKIEDTLYWSSALDSVEENIVRIDQNDEELRYCIAEKNNVEYWVHTDDVLPRVKNNKLNQKLYKEEIYKLEDEWIILKNT